MADQSNEYEKHLTQLGATLVSALTEEKRKTEAHLVALLISEVRRLEREREEIYAELLRTRHAANDEIDKLKFAIENTTRFYEKQKEQQEAKTLKDKEDLLELEAQLERMKKRRSKTNG